MSARWSAAGLAGALLAFAIPSELGAHPIGVGHRGGTVSRPENTVPAYDFSLAVGIEWVEMDVWLSADGVPVCHHDEGLVRTTNGTGPIHQKTLAELKTLDAGSWFSPLWAGTQIPTLEEALPYVDGRGKVLLDIKRIEYVAPVVQALSDAAFPTQDVVVWNRFGTGDPFKALLPGATVISASRRDMDWDQWCAERKSAGDLAMTESYQLMTPELVDLIHSYGLLVATNTVVSPEFQSQIDMGVDILVVSHPAGLAAMLPAYTPECMDGLDNDGDGLFDHPDDPSCFAPEDDAEYKACSDGIDNDGDSLVDYPDDPGCFASFSHVEDPACNDGLDNNGDGQIDFPNDGGCLAAYEHNEQFVCENGIDDDGDGAVDHAEDPGCSSVVDGSERSSEPGCDNDVDEDGDLLADYPADPGCREPGDATELHDCADGVDNDGDGRVDYPADPGCEDAGDGWERGSSVCDNGSDDEGDGLADYPADPGCRGPEDETEAIDCMDGTDNDGDGLVDFAADPGCADAEDGWEREPGVPRCDNGIDDDFDGFVDFPDDPDCPDANGIHEAPEPAALLQLAAGALGLAALNRRRSRR